MDLLRRWIKREHSIWKVAKEIGLEFRKTLKPLLIAAAAIVTAGAVFAALYLTNASFLRPAAYENAKSVSEASEVVVEETEVKEDVREDVRNLRLEANSGPFRVVIDGSMNLTSEGQKNERTIIVAELKRGNHSFTFHNSATEEIIEVEANIDTDNQTVQVFFKPPVKKEVARPAAPEVPEVKPTGSLFISSYPPSARIFVNGEDSGLKTPNLFENLSVGEYTVILVLEGYEDQSFTLTVREDETLREDLVLSEAFGQVIFDVRPTARILLDGNPLIETPYVKPVRIRAGRHIITIINEMLGVKKEIWIKLEQGQTLKIQEVLK
jgi:hypothetical protein